MQKQGQQALKEQERSQMNVLSSAILGICFLVLSFAVTFLMYYLWGFPFDKATRTSAAPKSLMRLHRYLGYTYLVVYLLMMSQMVPRLWQYQVEFPARTVAHMILGFLIGIVLLVKISIMRFFRHLEEWMPYLGTGLLVCTVLLLGLSLPSAFRERALATDTVGGSAYSQENRVRVAALLPLANFPAEAPLPELSTEHSLRAGQSVLLETCVRCHDIKTVLERPRTPADWVATVGRMAEKPALFAPMTQRDQWNVSAYLIAITPELQKSKQQQTEQEERQQQAQQILANPQAQAASAPVRDITTTKVTFQKVCAQCHALSEVDKSPPKTGAEVQALLQRMNRNGMQANKQELEDIQSYLMKSYVKTP